MIIKSGQAGIFLGIFYILEGKINSKGGDYLPDIKCSVNSCHYWKKNNICGANEIEVARNLAGKNDIEAGMFGNKSSTSNETQCVTFKPRESEKT